MGAPDLSQLFLVLCAILLGCLALFLFWFSQIRRPVALRRNAHNPILRPLPQHWWEAEAVFNPAAIYEGGRVHLLYRAMGSDGISRIGYASSKDGIHFDERLPYPVYEPRRGFGIPTPERRYGPLTYSQTAYASGGGWGGAEDPRMVRIENDVYMTFVAFDGWGFVRMALASLPVGDLLQKRWHWSAPALISPPNEMHKNWVLFPEKINGKFAVLHRVAPEIEIEYLEDLNELYQDHVFIKSGPPQGGRTGYWDEKMRGAGAPPIKTAEGWLLLYHATHEGKYKIGAMLLDLKNPTKVRYRSATAILSPEEWYENDWKPGVVYGSAAIIKDGELFVYYGGGDKYVAAARANLKEFLHKLTSNQHAELTPVKV